MVLGLAALVATLVGAFGGSWLGFYLGVRHQQSEDQKRTAEQNRAHVMVLLQALTQDLSVIHNVEKIIRDVGTPPHLPSTRNVFFPMWLRARFLTPSPYRHALNYPELTQLGQPTLVLIQQAGFAIDLLRRQLDNLNASWADAINLPDSALVRQGLWTAFEEGLRRGDGIPFTKKLAQKLLDTLSGAFPEVYFMVHRIEGVAPSPMARAATAISKPQSLASRAIAWAAAWIGCPRRRR